MTVREMVVDQLLLLSTVEADAVQIPDPVKREVTELWELCQNIFPTRVPRRRCDLPIGCMCGWMGVAQGSPGSHPEFLMRRRPRNSRSLLLSPQKTCPIRIGPMDNWDYRGAMDPNLVRDRTDAVSDDRAPSGQVTARVALV